MAMAGQAENSARELPADVQELFQYVQRYSPVTYNLDFRLQPFIPSFLPSLGSVDDQIKVPRPDGQPDFLGLTCTDEPALKQSDPALLALRLRHKLRMESSSRGSMQEQPLGWVEDPGQQPQKVESWIDAVSVLHQGEASTATVCSELIDLEALVQQWPEDMADHIRASSLPDPKQDVDLKAFTRMVCNMVDIPASANPIEALHTLFSLYLEFAVNPLLQQRHLFDQVEHGDLE